MISGNFFKQNLKWASLALVLALAAFLWIRGHHSPSSSTSPAAAGGISRRPAATAPGELAARIGSAKSTDYPELMRLVLKVKDPAAQQKLMAGLIRQWLQTDLASFAAFLDEAEVNGVPIWNRLGPGMMAALEGLGAVEDSFLLADLVERVINNAARTDPRSALVWARAQLHSDDLDSSLAAIATELAATDIEAAMALLPEIKSMANRVESATGIGARLGGQDPDRGLAWARDFPRESERAFAYAGVLSGMSQRDVARAAAEYSELVTAMKEAYRQQVTADRASAGLNVEEEYEGLSPEEILKAELAKPNPNLIYLDRAAFIIGTAMAARDPIAALEWAGALDIYQGKVAAVEAIFGAWSATAPDAAFEAYLQQDERRPQITERLFSGWASRQPEAARSASATLAPGPERDAAAEGIALGWLEAGATPREIARWSDALARSSEQDHVRAVLASEAANEDPAFALTQLEQVRNPAKRAELFHEVFPSLVQADPRAARRALADSRLSQVEVEYFTGMLGTN